ncbi:MAG: hypothetical protein J0H74_15930 [Chitinophagaceae bacterium]|nr:hypothetical protein [Chitinophagaceae bacterium]
MGVNFVQMVPILPRDTPDPLTVPNLQRIQQCQGFWCWAACTQMVLRQHGDTTTQQCDMAKFLFNQTKCCEKPASNECNNRCESDDIKKVYNHFGRVCSLPAKIDGLAGPDLDQFLEAIKVEIRAGRPVEIGYELDKVGSHVVLIAGFVGVGAGTSFIVLDPLADRGCVASGGLPTLDGRGNWKLSWTGIQ